MQENTTRNIYNVWSYFYDLFWPSIVHRRTTALYCSGKCRELHNARKRREARELKNAAQPACAPEASHAPETKA